SRSVPLNQVIGHHHVDGVLDTPLRHVTVEARAGCTSRTGPLRRGRRAGGCRSGVRRCVAAGADLDVMRDGGLTARNVVRVMARGAGHRGALEAGRLAEPVRRAADDLELVLTSAARCVIEVNEIVAEGRSGHVGERRPIEAADLEWQRTAGRFEVALETHLDLPIAPEPGRIDDGATRRLTVTGPGRVDVSLAGAVTPLTVDALGERLRKPRSAARVDNRPAGIAVVARHAVRRNH